MCTYIITIVTEINGPLLLALCDRSEGIRDDNRLHFARSRFELNSKLHPAVQLQYREKISAIVSPAEIMPRSASNAFF